jgi:cellulose synthase/poly-beta-1,6-N-acetylglucosamine synthase-like glycosyltransferase
MMVTNPRVTVCIPTYNRAGYLSQCLSSVLAQTFRDFEVIVSDNCSTDATGEIVRACGDPRVRYVRNDRNLGVFPNMNRCLELATGEYVCILHDDDLYAPQFLERETRMLDQHPNAGFVHAAAYQIDAAGACLGLRRSYPRDCLLDGKEEFVRYLQGHNVWCPTVMVRRDLYRKVGGFDPSYLCSDFLMWLRLSLRADVAYIAEPLAAVRVHTAALSSSIPPNRWCEDFFDILDQGFCLAESQRPALIRSREQVMRGAVRAQGKRFFIAAVASLATGDVHAAEGYMAVLHELERRGLPSIYFLLAKAFQNPAGLSLLTLTRQLRRTWKASRMPVEEAWCSVPAPSYSNVQPG